MLRVTGVVRWPANRGRAAAVVIGALLAAGIIVVLLGPAPWWLAGSAVQRLADSPDKQLAAVDAARGRLFQLILGVGAIGTLVFTAKTYALSREGHVTDRYTKAVDQLGAKTTDQQIGGIYALERIMRDSAKDHAAVVQVLTAFVREHAALGKEPVVVTARERIVGSPTTGERRLSDKPPRPLAQVQAALSVLGQRPDRPGAEADCLRLSETVLMRAFLRGALLSCARLRLAQLQYAHLERAKLEGARLHGAHLEHARLRGARLEYADLEDSYLDDAHLNDAHLDHANLVGANMARTRLRPPGVPRTQKGADVGKVS